MKMMYDLVDSIGDKFAEAVNKELKISSKIEFRQLLAKYTTDVISSVAFGINSNCELANKVKLSRSSQEFLRRSRRS